MCAAVRGLCSLFCAARDRTGQPRASSNSITLLEYLLLWLWLGPVELTAADAIPAGEAIDFYHYLTKQLGASMLCFSFLNREDAVKLASSQPLIRMNEGASGLFSLCLRSLSGRLEVKAGARTYFLRNLVLTDPRDCELVRAELR